MSENPHITAEFTMFPIDKGVSLSPYVAKILAIVDESNVDYQFHAMGTILEGNWDEVFEVIRKCHMVLEKDCNRISTSVNIDYNRHGKNNITRKIESVETKLGRKLRTKKE